MSTEIKPPESAPEVHVPSHHGPALPGPGKGKKRGLIWVVFLLLIAGVAGYAVWRAGDPGTAPKTQGGGGGGFGGGGRGGSMGPVPVVVTKISRSSIPVYLNGLGNVTPYYTVTVKSRVDGQLIKVHFNEGDFVKEGQTLIEIDPRPFQVQLEMAEATLAHDQALLANAKVDLDRYKLLVKTDAIPSQQLDTQTALVAQYEATIKQDQANIDNAKLQLVYSKITAPITGVLGLRLVDPGNIVHASDANGMITITQLQPISVLFTIPEDSLPQVTQKLRAGAHLPADAYNRDNSKKLASGTLLTLDNQIDATTGTSKLKAVFDNKDNTLFPQQFVNVRLLVDTLTNQAVVPNVAVQNGQQGTFVYVVDDDSRVHLKPVQVGITTATGTQILGGLTDGDRVVVDGTDRLIEGATVRVRKPGELENPPGYDGGAGGGRKGRGGRKGGGEFKKGGDSGNAGRNGGSVR
ncbi:MAG TPA: MdtA/MuxA family multidrug efflux RND transporter periplasmic adaptor subunit [Verrucomicrobiae bacterium]|nr:MdtA/MuxA family multidrug efflux RND transporter periplasmic adaptor subunit [Verrucomicrobiae bacterium]